MKKQIIITTICILALVILSLSLSFTSQDVSAQDPPPRETYGTIPVRETETPPPRATYETPPPRATYETPPSRFEGPFLPIIKRLRGE